MRREIASDGAGEPTKLIRGSSVQTWQITPMATKNQCNVKQWPLPVHLSDVRFLIDHIRQTRSHSSRGWLWTAGWRSAPEFMDGSSHFPIPDGLGFNHTRAPSEAVHAPGWVHPKSSQRERKRAQRGARFLREMRAKRAIGARQGEEEAFSQRKRDAEYLLSLTPSCLGWRQPFMKSPGRGRYREGRKNQSPLRARCSWREGTLATNKSLIRVVRAST